MKLFDGPRIGEIESILNSRDQEARGVVYLWAEKWLAFQARRMENRVGVMAGSELYWVPRRSSR